MKRREPDWDELKRIGARAEAMQLAGQLDYDAWRALVAEADVACNSYPQFSEFMQHFAEAGWLNRLFAEPKNKRARKPNRAA